MDNFPSGILPDRVSRLEPSWNTTIVEYENGAETRFDNRHLATYNYMFEWKMLNSTDLDTLIDFFNDQSGAYRKWKITDTRIGTNVEMRFFKDKLTIQKVNAYFSNVSIEVKTC